MIECKMYIHRLDLFKKLKILTFPSTFLCLILLATRDYPNGVWNSLTSFTVLLVYMDFKSTDFKSDVMIRSSLRSHPR